MPIDLSKMTRKQLEKLKIDVEKALASIEQQERREAKKAAEAAAAKFGFSLADLTGTSGKSGKKGGAKNPGTPKFANPENPTETWTGKGRQPQWYKDAIAAGTDPKSLEI